MDALEALPTDQLTMMLSIGGTLDVNPAYAAGRLLAERAKLARQAGNAPFSTILDAGSLQLLVATARAFDRYLNDSHRTAVVSVAERLLSPSADVQPTLVCDVLDAHQRS